MKCVIGVDLGGTNVRAQAYSEGGQATGERVEIPSRAQEGTPAILDALTDAIERARANSSMPPERVGLAIPGFVDDAAGMVRWAPNLGHFEGEVFHYWKDVLISPILAERVGIPVSMGNDANLAALGEYMYGLGEGTAKCLVMITLGTGVGGGVVTAPSTVQGVASSPLTLLGGNLGGMELGHILIQPGGLDCNAGSYGSLEAYCQRDGIITRARHRLNRGLRSAMTEMVGGDLNELTPKVIYEAAAAGDSVAIEVFEEVGTILGYGLASLINIFAPEVIAVGGQIANAGEFILGPARKSARNSSIPALFDFCKKIEKAKELDDAGILGAAALALG